MQINMTKSTYKTLKVFDSIFAENPVLFFGLSIAPIVTVATSLKAAVVLSLASFIIMIPTVVLSSIIADRVRKGFRIVIYCLMAAVLYIPAFWVVQTFFSDVLNIVGVFMPLLVVNQILIIKANYHSHVKNPLKAFLDIFSSLIGLSGVLYIVAVIRELIGYGTVWGYTIFKSPPVPAASLPFMGFIILGFLCALATVVHRKLRRAVRVNGQPLPDKTDDSEEEGACEQ